MDILCPSCQSKNNISMGKIPEMDTFAGNKLSTPLPQSFLISCKDCGLYFKWPRLSAKRLNELYQNGNPENWQYKLNQRRDWLIAKNWIDKNFSGGAILDIGCWDGKYLDCFRGSHELYGIEINRNAADKATSKGINMISNDICEMGSLSIEVDVTTAFDVIEHVEYPFEFIASSVRLTKAGGAIIISSGDTEALTWKICRNRYWYCAIPEHISFINKTWCNFVAEKLKLKVKHIGRFSHINKSGIVHKIIDLSKNISYLTMSAYEEYLNKIRCHYYSKNDARGIYNSPPFWMTSKNHLIIIFEKKQ